MAKKRLKIDNPAIIYISVLAIIAVIVVEISVFRNFYNQVLDEADAALKSQVEAIDHNISVAIKNKKLKFNEDRVALRNRFSEIALGGVSNTDYWVIAYNPSSEVLVLNAKRYPKSYAIDTITSATCYHGAVQTLIEHNEHDEKTVQAQKYEYSGSKNPQRLAFINAAYSENGIFSVAVAVDYSNIILPLRASGLQLIVCGAVLVLCVIVLAFGLLTNTKKVEQAHEEITELEQKTAAMQEIIDTSENLMHIQRLETIGTLTAGVAHEFNNLLMPIMGYSMMALDKIPEDDSEFYDEMIQIYESSKRAKDIVSRLSALSRKNTPQNYVLVSPDSLIAQAKSVAMSSAKENIVVEEKLNCPDKVLSCNETQISQIIINLMINAFQAMEKTGGKLLIETKSEGEEIIIRFSDNGPGIPEENAKKIFEPFFTTKESGKGTGLGLPICRHIAEEHGGSLNLVASDGPGASFEIRLPRQS